MKYKSFTLIQSLIVLAVFGVIITIVTPVITGSSNASKEAKAKNSLHSICVIEADYRAETGDYFDTPIGDHTALINKTLFNGKKILDEQSDYKYYIQKFSSSSYRAYAVPKDKDSDLNKICIDHNDEFSFGSKC